MNKSEKKNKSLKEETISSGAWGFMDKGTSVVIQFIIGIVLARLLPPSDFGLIGLGLIVVGFGRIFVNLGLGPALIQKQNLTERHVRVVFTTSAIAGIVLSLICFFIAPLAAWILDNAHVTPIIKALSVIFIIAALQIPSRSLLTKQLDFRYIFYISLISRLFYGTVTITLALAGFGVWSLVIGNILQRLISFACSYWYVRHSLKPLFAKKEFYDLLHFGSGMTLSGVFSYFALQGDYFIIGRVLGAGALGLYTKAYTLMLLPTTKFVSVLSNVLFPAASRIQKDKERLRKVFIKTMNIIAFVTMPVCTILVMLAPELVLGLYGENWRGTILPLQILGIFGVFRALYNASAAFLRAKGLVYRILTAQIVYGFIMISGVWIGASTHGLTGASIAVGTAIFIMWCMFMEINRRAIDIEWRTIIRTLLPGLIISVMVSIPAMLINYFVGEYVSSHLLNLVISSISTFIIFCITFLYSPQKLFHYLPSELYMMVKDYLPHKANVFLKNYTKLQKR